ncbi:acinetobactin non-ribosomal peptide synthetase subunit BasA [Acinetobacter baumannii]|jgi:amino acid adenylation domain-containing protein|uniref:acinetobactin non-ribosomal peptide synthetase subunit BasA n=1 Tax=Acinetobacter TaxID=469 RepID=UPI0007077160|nr:acinetobactin non-ribosomal peptide synthetase subunit BasA [Acinetobacter baumannii]EHU1304960.1 acinetobactin non-ribosomal peptide synthetase subunit BasA [Acinetobacter baumannii]EHU1308357.1 acinetobactin non-ribosomal peptide synthetase subunit BasA [Acinetobacter baumannii]EHU1427631.1 acinetobactin non-ribosomal peptide synthetase subunit BasA [Acinetobacter baumannii]EHU1430935.1 acinetobactin non-ribosomal peptide synthetase subunit BasA [Acinetobacter baumannii]EHU2158219.1 acine
MLKDLSQNLGQMNDKNNNVENFLKRIYENIFDKNSNRTALIFEGRSISYAEVGTQVAKVMYALRKQDLATGSVVAICLRKSPEYIYTALACALTGIIWLPVDMDSPPSRLNYLLTNSRADVVVSDSSIAGVQNLNINEILSATTEYEPSLNAEINRRPAYYLYTSGSTGTPKCVVLNNQATENTLQQTISEWEITADDVIMAVTPFHHDMSVFDVFASMAVGATLVVPSFEQSKNAVVWANLVDRCKVTIWSSVPAIVDMLFSVAQKEQLQSLRLIAQGGDYIKPSLIAKLRQQLPNARLFSLGGPTETTIWSIWHEINEQDQEIIPYGKALENNRYFILDENLKPCQMGEVGTMYMAGLNLSNGYLLDGEINYKDFVDIQVSENETQTAFRMSDQGYFREDGNIIFAGREEGYLKIKGVRISAAEVENALMKNPYIHNCVVISCVHPTTETQELVAVYTLENKYKTTRLNSPELKNFLKIHLPSSHIPSKYLAVETIPLTRNGKIDRKAVQEIAQGKIYVTSALSANSSKASSAVAEVGDSVLSVFRECIADSQAEKMDIFYRSEILDIGIRPKQLMSIAQKLSQKLNTQIDFYTLVSCKTIQDVVNKVEQQIK